MTRRIGSWLTAVLCLYGQEVPLFRSQSRIVEVYATIYDHRGRYVDGLTQSQFEVIDNGQPQQVVSFEGVSGSVTCALLLDTTGSMVETLPVVKNAVSRVIDALRPGDSAAIYTFGNTVTKIQDFTQDHAALKRAMLRTRAMGMTALFDAVTLVARELPAQQGKKLIVVFTDGADNASVLNATSAMTRARKAGVPIYAVAQGDAMHDSALVKGLRTLAEGTGGILYKAKKSQEIDKIFEDIVADLQHTYMLAYKPPEAAGGAWRKIQLNISGMSNYKVRAKEGYFAE